MAVAPRDYQRCLFEDAVERNTIAYLPTGMGKTLISVMLIKYFLSLESKKQNIIFLAPTIPLVSQQTKYIRKHTEGLNVVSYVGDEGWERKAWREVVNQQDVIVMTPMLLYNILVTGFLHIEDIGLLIFDECHHCSKKHPYNLIFMDFYFPTDKHLRPHILGMTASPIIKSIKTQSQSDFGVCEICGTHYESLFLKEQHLQGKKHKKKLARISLTGEKITSTVESLPISVKSTSQQIEESLLRLEYQMDSTLSIPDDLSDEYQSFFITPNEEYISYRKIDDNKIRSVINLLTRSFPSEDGRLHSTSEQNALKLITSDRLIDILKELGSVSFFLYLNLYLQSISNRELSLSLKLQSDRRISIIEEVQVKLFYWLSDAISGGDASHLFSPKMNSLFSTLQQFFNGELRVIAQKTFPDLEDNMVQGKADDREGRVIIFVKERKVALLLANILSGEGIITVDGKSSYPIGKFVQHKHRVGVLLGRSTISTQKDVMEKFHQGDYNILVSTSVAEEGLDIQSCNLVICFDDKYMRLKSYIQRKGRARKRNSTFLYYCCNQELTDLQEQEKEIIRVIQTRSYKNLTLETPTRETYRECVTSPSGGKITEHSAKSVLNHYISLLPSDIYWRPTIYYKSIKDVTNDTYTSRCYLPVNCPLPEESYKGEIYPTRKSADSSAALRVCRELYDQQILDDHFLPHAELEADLLNSRCEVNQEIEQQTEFALPIASNWEPIPTSIPPHETILLYDTPIIIEGKDSEIREIHILSKVEFCEPLIISKGLKLLTTICPSSKVVLSAEEFAKHVQIHLQIQTYFFVSTATRIGKPRPNPPPEQVIYLQFFPGINLDQLSIPKRVENFDQCAETLSKELEGKLVFIQCDPLKRLWYVEGVEQGLKPSSPMRENALMTFAEYYQSKYNYSGELCDEQALINISSVIKTKNFDLKEESKYWKGKGILAAIPQLCSIFPVSALQFQAIQVLPVIMWELNHVLLMRQFRRDCSLTNMEKWEDSLARTLLTTAGCQCEGLNREEIFDLLLQMAFTAPIGNSNFNYELLETLGDSFLKFSVSDYLYSKHPVQHEGILTAMRTKIISNINLYRLAMDKKLFQYVNTVYKAPLTFGDTCIIPKKRLADIVEALIGVFILTGGQPGGRRFLQWLGVPCFGPDDIIQDLSKQEEEQNETKPEDIQNIESLIHYKFNDWRLIHTARIHASYRKSRQCFQRLEFLGDAVLDFVVTLFFFDKFCEELSPHLLTVLRSESVSNDTFAKATITSGLHQFILHDSKYISEQLVRFERHVKRVQSKKRTERFLENLAYRTPKIVADIFESFAGAVYLDCGRSTRIVWRTFFPLLQQHYAGVSPSSLQKHPIAILHHLQEKDIRFRSSMNVQRSYSSHIFVFTYFVNDEYLSEAEDKNKASSSTKAAISALGKLFDYAVRASTDGQF